MKLGKNITPVMANEHLYFLISYLQWHQHGGSENIRGASGTSIA